MSFENWLEKQALQERKYVGFFDSIKENKFFKYFNYRLKYLYIRTGVGLIIHLLEFLILFHLFSILIAGFVFVFRMILYFFDSFWWGALEHLRERVRNFYENKDFKNIKLIFNTYMKYSIILFFLIMLSASIHVFLEYNVNKVFAIYHLYIIAIALYSAVDVIFRVYHSTVYAVSRIYRPLNAIIVVQISFFASTLSLFPIISFWSVPVGLIISAFIKFIIGIHYTSRRYTSLNLHNITFKSIFKKTSSVNSKELLQAGFSSALARIDIIFTLFLIISLFVSGFSLLVIILYLISPLFRFLLVWPNLFYFDMVKIRRNKLHILINYIKNKLKNYGLILSLSLFSVSFSIIYFLTLFFELKVYISLFLFFMTVPLWGIAQTYLFSFYDFKKSLIFSFFAILIWLTSYLLFDFETSLIFLSFYFILSYYLIFKMDTKDFTSDSFYTSIPEIITSKKIKWFISLNDEKTKIIQPLKLSSNKNYILKLAKISDKEYILLTEKLQKKDIIKLFAGNIVFLDKLNKDKTLNYFKQRFGFITKKQLDEKLKKYGAKIISKNILFELIEEKNLDWIRNYSLNPSLKKIGDFYATAYFPKGIIKEIILIPKKYKNEAKNLHKKLIFLSIKDSYKERKSSSKLFK